MYGVDAYGTQPYGASSFGPEDVFDVEAMLAEPRADLVVTAEFRMKEIGGSDPEERLRVASAPWATRPDDVPSSTPYMPRLESFNFKRSINNGDRFGGMATGDGQIVVANTDGALDAYIDGYAFDGREVIVRLGRKTDLQEHHYILFRGVVANVSADDDKVTFTLRDKSDKLNVPAQPNVYAGTGDAEGGADLTGKRKPKVYGRVVGVEPVLVNPSALIYQVTDGPAQLISSVFDRGVQLIDDGDYADYAALASASIAGGRFATAEAVGLFRLGAAPSGIVFATVRVDNDATTASIIRELVEDATELADGDFDLSRFDAVSLAVPERPGYWLSPDEADTAVNATARLLAGIGGFAGFDRLGHFFIGIFTAPAGNPVAYFDRDDGSIIDLSRDTMPAGIWPPPWRVRVGYEHVKTVFTDFASSVDAATRSFYSMPYRLATSEDASVLTDHLNAQDWAPIEGWIDLPVSADSLAAAQAEADRQLALYTSGYWLYRMSTDRRGLTLKIGDEINVTWPRFGLDAGRNGIVVSIEHKMDLREGGEVDQVEIGWFG